jgi:zinc transport system permease protein
MIDWLNLQTTEFVWWSLPLLAGLGTALLAGPLGCFVVWQRMAYFGESLAHSALLGVALGLWLGITSFITVIGCGMLLALLLAHFRQYSQFSTDTLLGILSHTLLAGGLVVLATLPSVRVNIDSLLFGDLLSVSLTDTLLIYALLISLYIVFAYLWQPLIAMTVHEELAQAEGIPVARIRTILMCMMAAVVAVAMKVVGVLLMTSLLIIPAAIAYRYAKSPEQMAAMSSIIGVMAVTGGALLSWFLNTPVGPSIVLFAGLFFINAAIFDKIRG